MKWDWKGVGQSAVAGAIGAIIGTALIAIAIFVWSWLSSGGLINALGGVRQTEMIKVGVRLDALEKASHVSAPKIKISDARFSSDFTNGYHGPTDGDLLKILSKECDDKALCSVDGAKFHEIDPEYSYINVTYYCSSKKMGAEKFANGATLVLICPPAN